MTKVSFDRMTNGRKSEELVSSSSVPPSGRVYYELYWLAIMGADPGPLTPAEAVLFDRLRDEFSANPGSDLWPIDDG